MVHSVHGLPVHACALLASLAASSRALRAAAPAVSAGAAGRRHHAMAGDDQAHGIGGAGPGHGADRLRLADASAPPPHRRGSRRTESAAARATPSTETPWPARRSAGRATARRRAGARRSPSPIRARGFGRRRYSAAGYSRRRSLASAPASLSPIFTEHTPFSVAATSTRPTGLGIDRVADAHARAAAAIVRERHALAGRRGLVDAARRAIPRFVNRGRHVAAIAQARAQLDRRAPPPGIPAATARRSP